ncbi:MAG: hypothetical protein ACTSU5_02210 [Promethearchaeota archaeon]
MEPSEFIEHLRKNLTTVAQELGRRRWLKDVGEKVVSTGDIEKALAFARDAAAAGGAGLRGIWEEHFGRPGGGDGA